MQISSTVKGTPSSGTAVRDCRRKNDDWLEEGSRMRFKIAICQEIFKELEFHEFCKVISGIGYDGLELAPFMLRDDLRDLTRRQAKDLAGVARQNGLEIAAFHWLLSSPPGFSITSPDGHVQEETRDFFASIVDAASSMNVPVLVFGSPKQRNIDPSWNVPESRQRAIMFFKEMSRLCAMKSIKIAFEPLGPTVTNFGATFNDSMELVKAVNSPAFGLHLDVKAMSSDPLSIKEQITRAGDTLLHFHANDPNLLGPGMGGVDYIPILAALKDIGYTGWLSVETFRDDIPAREIAKESISYLREVMGSKK
ncbi:MAG: sugar phosphate isomerase/epimerase family protein [Promethearchaeota archaeon]